MHPHWVEPDEDALVTRIGENARTEHGIVDIPGELLDVVRAGITSVDR